LRILTRQKNENAKILIVDDNKEVRETLIDILNCLEYETVQAVDGEEGFKFLQNQNIDLVITDLKMPGGSGIDLLQKIKLIDSNIPVIIITGFPSLNTAIEAMKKGASDFITKPFNIDYIQHIVKKALQERQLLLENQYLLAELNQKAIIERLNSELHEKIDELTKIQSINEALNVFVDNEKLFQQIIKIASRTTDAKRVALFILDTEKSQLFIRCGIGYNKEIIQRTRLFIGQGIVGQIALHKKAFRLNSKSIHVDNLSFPFEEVVPESILSVPIFVGEDFFGVLYLADKNGEPEFTQNDEKIIVTLADKAGIRIENNALYEGVYLNLLDTLMSLVSTIEAKDFYTRQHSFRVTEYAIKIVKKLGVDDEQIEILRFGGFLHDIGKIGIQDSLLNKRGRLTNEEFEIIRQHPLVGVKIVEPLCLIDEEKNIIKYHHERWDGSGYPEGLRKDSIPFLARVLSVADSFDAMTSTRPYRKAMSQDMAAREIIDSSGSQFDPEIIEAFSQSGSDLQNSKIS